MTTQQGTDSQLMFSIESVKNTRTAPAISLAILQESIKLRSPAVKQEGIRAGRKTHKFQKLGAKDISGGFSCDLQAETMIPLWTLLIGGSVPTPTGSDPYTYTLNPGDLATASIQTSPGGTHRFDYTGMMCDRWTVRQDPNQYARLETQWFGYDKLAADANAKTTFSENAAPTFFGFDEMTITAQGNTVCADSLVLNGMNNVQRTYPMCSTYGRNARVEDGRRRMFSGSFANAFEDLTLYNLSVAGTEGTMVLAWSDGTYSITFTMEVWFPPDTPNITGHESITHNVEFEVIGGAADSDAFELVVVNDEATAS